MPGRGDRDELGQALDDAEQDGGEGQSHGRARHGGAGGEVNRPLRASSHQMRTRSSGGRYSVVVGRDVERLVPGVEVAHRAVDAVLLGGCADRSAAAGGAIASRCIARHTCAQARKKRWSPVRPSITGASLPFERQLVGAVGHAEAAEVADVLAQREPAVDAGRAVVERADRRRTARPSLSPSAVEARRGPRRSTSCAACRCRRTCAPWSSKPWPISWPITAPIAAVVDRRVGVGVEERRLQDRRREHDLVERRVVVGVDRLRHHAPLGPVDRLAELASGCRPAPADRARRGCRARRRARSSRPVVGLELVGIADLRRERVELGDAPRALVAVGHPVVLVDARGQRAAQVARPARPSPPCSPAGSSARRRAGRAPRRAALGRGDRALPARRAAPAGRSAACRRRRSWRRRSRSAAPARGR